MSVSSLGGLLHPTRLKRTFFFVLSDSALIAFSLFLSFLLRFDFAVPDRYQEIMLSALPLFISLKLVSFTGFRLYQITWKYVGIRDLWNVLGAIVLSQALLMVLVLVPLHPFSQARPLGYLSGFPRSIFIIDGLLCLIAISAVRISKRVFLEVLQKQTVARNGKRTLIIGGGHTGEMILRDITRQSFSEFYPVGILDDDDDKQGTYIHGVKVLGTTEEVNTSIRKQRAEAVIIAIPTLNYKQLRSIYNSARETGVSSIKIIQRIYDLNRPDISLKKLEEIKIEDLIGRQSVSVDYKSIEQFLTGTTVLVTGAGGSIGSEIVMQLCAFRPGRLVLFDIDETELHNMELKLKRLFPDLAEALIFVVGDIRDEELVQEVFRAYKPDIAFHAAAYKHVPMMEYNPREAVKVNIVGTHNVVKASRANGTRKFIMISTDKAVRPTSVMGATKRIAEYICKAYNDACATEFISIRFGNVLGSRGSVLPLFLEQLNSGGPITVTHPDIKRYFMTIPEAVSLVLQASAIGEGGQIMILDMGEQVKIVKLAEELIRLHGLEPYRDIEIRFVGLRPGEKLYEELFTNEEETLKTRHEKVFIAKNVDSRSIGEVEEVVVEFESALKATTLGEGGAIRLLLKKHVPHFMSESPTGTHEPSVQA